MSVWEAHVQGVIKNRQELSFLHYSIYVTDILAVYCATKLKITTLNLHRKHFSVMLYNLARVHFFADRNRYRKNC